MVLPRNPCRKSQKRSWTWQNFAWTVWLSHDANRVVARRDDSSHVRSVPVNVLAGCAKKTEGVLSRHFGGQAQVRVAEIEPGIHDRHAHPGSRHAERPRGGSDPLDTRGNHLRSRRPRQGRCVFRIAVGRISTRIVGFDSIRVGGLGSESRIAVARDVGTHLDELHEARWALFGLEEKAAFLRWPCELAARQNLA